MVWAVTTNSDSSDDSLTVNKGREITLNDGNTYSFDLPDDDVAADDQEYYLIVNVSNTSTLNIRTMTTRPSGTQTTIRSVVNSVAIHFIFDGTNNKWRIISDDKVKSIEDTEHPLTALSGNPVKDNDGNFIEQSGVEVVGINSINGCSPVFSSDGEFLWHLNNNNICAACNHGTVYVLKEYDQADAFDILEQYVPNVGDTCPARGVIDWNVNGGTSAIRMTIEYVYHEQSGKIIISGPCLSYSTSYDPVSTTAREFFVYDAPGDYYWIYNPINTFFVII